MVWTKDYIFLSLPDWIFTNDPSQEETCIQFCKHETTLSKAINPWLRILDERRPLLRKMVETGRAAGFRDGQRLAKDLLEGKLSHGALQGLVNYAQASFRSPIEPFSAERNHFGDQFRHPYPNMGLLGFLHKRAQRFEIAPRMRQELYLLLDWLDAPHGKTIAP